MLNHLGHPALEARVQAAARGALAAGEVTKDLGGSLSTSQVTDAVLARLAR
jgi:isocitrate/isopropylmalate dehydrogenase